MITDIKSESFNEREYLKATGAEFLRVRLLRGMTRESLSDLSGVHIETIGATERGEHDMSSTTK